MIFLKRLSLTTILLCLMLSFSAAVHAESRTSSQEAFITYRCDYEEATNTARIFAALTDTNGLPMPRDRYTITVTTSDTVEVVPPQRLGISMLPLRQPLRMIIVMDTTDTMPLAELVQAISTRLVPKLDVNDQVAFLRVDSTISTLTTFYIDKNRLINEHMLTLEPGFGDNQVYNAINQAVEELGTNTGTRQVVLVLTDSKPRNPDDQATAAEIGTRARNAHVQVYPIGIFLYDEPNADDLIEMAQSSQGFAWIYDESGSNNASTGVAVGDRLEDLVETLDSEIVIAIDMRGQVPDANAEVRFDVAVDLQNGLKLSDQIACPYNVTSHSIAFAAGTPATQTTSEPVEITVQVGTNFSNEETSIVFRRNEEPVQNSDNLTYTFDAAAEPPGTYTISAELRDRNDNILATTPQSISITTQPVINLQLISGSLSDLGQPLVLQVDTPSSITLPDARFTIYKVREPQISYPLGAAIAPFQTGRAILTVPNIKAEIERLFPGIQTGEVLEILATVPDAASRGSTLAESTPLTFTYSSTGTTDIAALSGTATAVAAVIQGVSITPVAGATQVPVIVPTPIVPPASSTFLGVTLPEFLTNADRVVLISLIVGFILLILNWLLFFQIGRQRIRRMILNPDSSEMSPRLMALTLRRDSLKQTMVLTKRTVTLGRGNLNDVNLGDSTSISREHGVVMWRRGKWFYSNRKPRLKCRVDGKRYSGYILKELEPVTEIEVGDAKIFFHSSTQQDVSEFSKTTL